MKVLRIAAAFTLFLALLTSCGATSQEARARKAAEKEAQRLAIVNAIESQNFDLEITRIIPRGFPARVSQGEYSLKIRGNVVNTRLPFYGESHAATIGGDEISIVFNKEKVNMVKDFADASKGEYRFMFRGGSSNEIWTVTLQIYDNGAANIGCQSASGSYMSYFADLVIPKE